MEKSWSFFSYIFLFNMSLIKTFRAKKVWFTTIYKIACRLFSIFVNYNKKIDKNIVLDYAIAGKHAAKCILDFRYSKQAPPVAANDI